MTKLSAEICDNMARAIACAHLPYSGAAMVCLPDGRQITREEFWLSLSDDARHLYLIQASMAFSVMEGYGLDICMQEAFKDYIAEK